MAPIQKIRVLCLDQYDQFQGSTYIIPCSQKKHGHFGEFLSPYYRCNRSFLCDDDNRPNQATDDELSRQSSLVFTWWKKYFWSIIICQFYFRYLELVENEDRFHLVEGGDLNLVDGKLFL